MSAVERMIEMIGLSPVENKISFECLEMFDCGAYILINHQHNRELNLGKSEVCGIAGNPLQAFGSVLAENGFIVISPDAVCFEERRANSKGTDENANRLINA